MSWPFVFGTMLAYYGFRAGWCEKAGLIEDELIWILGIVGLLIAMLVVS